MSAVSGVAVTKTGIYRPVIWLAFAVYAVGLGLMSMLDSHSSRYVSFFNCQHLAQKPSKCREGHLSIDRCIRPRCIVPGEDIGANH